MENNYWDQDSGLLKAVPWERDQNMLLRTAYFKIFGGSLVHGMFGINKSLMIMFQDGNWAQHPYTTYKLDRSSHDEITAAFFFSSINQSYYIEKTKVYKYLFYLQVFFFLLACKYKWQWAISAAYLAMDHSTSKRSKAKNGKWDTDGALLSLLKIETFKNLGINNTWRDREIEFNIQCVWGDKKELIREMLSDELHPLRRLVDGQ